MKKCHFRSQVLYVGTQHARCVLVPVCPCDDSVYAKRPKNWVLNLFEWSDMKDMAVCLCVSVCVWDRVEDTTSQAAAPQAPHIEQQQLVHNIEVYIFICSMVCKCWVLFFFTSSLPTNAFPSFDNFFLILSRATDCEFDYSFSFPTLFSLFFLFCHEVWSLLLLHRCAMSHLCTSRNTRMTFCLSFNSERK